MPIVPEMFFNDIVLFPTHLFPSPNPFLTFSLSGLQHLLVASTDGFVYCFRVPVDGGQCELIKQHRVGGKGARGSPPTEGGTPPTRPPRAGDRGGERSTPPDTSDLDEFPPMSHNSGH